MKKTKKDSTNKKQETEKNKKMNNKQRTMKELPTNKKQENDTQRKLTHQTACNHNSTHVHQRNKKNSTKQCAKTTMTTTTKMKQTDHPP